MQTRRRDPRPLEPEATGRQGHSVRMESDPIMSELRRFYDGIVDEPIPTELLELLRKLDEAERNR